MARTKNLSLVSCIATSLLAYVCTVPLHEFFHLLTDYAYGNSVAWFSAGAVQPIWLIDPSALSPFHRIMVSGGSASLINAFIALVLCVVVFKLSMGPTLRLFLVQLMGGQLGQGVGYFLIGGLFGIGDWGNVFAMFPENPGLVVALRIVLSIVGVAGTLFALVILTRVSYFFVKDPFNKDERKSVGLKLHLTMFVVGMTVGALSMIKSPMVASGELPFLKQIRLPMASYFTQST